MPLHSWKNTSTTNVVSVTFLLPPKEALLLCN
ncbi:MAG: CRISPR-associated protein Cas5, partial [Tannerellaceae bacterium]